MLYDLLKTLRVNDIEHTARTAGSSATLNKNHLQALSEKVDVLSLLTVASLELLAEAGVSESRIEQKIEEVDLRDGVADGRLGAPAQCRDCGHKVSPKRSYCFYCGASLTVLPLS
tara:strand:- start:2912 stop:3256 length:345 start_codon:yes stop_codon:yes gene_type:complete